MKLFSVDATEPYWCEVNIGLGKGLVPSGDKPLTQSILAQFYVAKWHH